MDGAERIFTERRRQQAQEGWTVEHDQEEHPNEELLDAALCYISNAHSNFEIDADTWPWHESWDKRSKHDDIRSLEIAGALIAAEIDRRTAPEDPVEHHYIVEEINTAEKAGGIVPRTRYSAVLRDVPRADHPTSDLQDIKIPLTEQQAAKLARHIGGQISISINLPRK